MHARQDTTAAGTSAGEAVAITRGLRMNADRRSPGVNAALWIVQVLLAALFIWAGGLKLVLPIEKMAGPIAMPGGFLRFIGVAELLGGIGLILPSLLRITPWLTPLAASGLVIIMIGATIIGLKAGLVMTLLPLVVGLLAAFVAYGRWRLAPIAPATHRRSALRRPS